MVPRFLDPGIGIERTIQSWGWTGFVFDWIKDPDRAIYTVVIAAAMPFGPEPTTTTSAIARSAANRATSAIS